MYIHRIYIYFARNIFVPIYFVITLVNKVLVCKIFGTGVTGTGLDFVPTIANCRDKIGFVPTIILIRTEIRYDKIPKKPFYCT